MAVEVNGDTLTENTERFSLVLTPPDSPSIGTGGAVGEATLLDDDTGPGPSLSIAAADPAQESSSSFLRFVVTLSEASVDSVTVNYRLRLAGTATDHDLFYAPTSLSNNGTLTFAPGQTTQSIYILANRDGLRRARRARGCGVVRRQRRDAGE